MAVTTNDTAWPISQRIGLARANTKRVTGAYVDRAIPRAVAL